MFNLPDVATHVGVEPFDFGLNFYEPGPRLVARTLSEVALRNTCI